MTHSQSRKMTYCWKFNWRIPGITSTVRRFQYDFSNKRLILIDSNHRKCAIYKWNTSCENRFKFEEDVTTHTANSCYPGENPRHQKWWCAFDHRNLERILWWYDLWLEDRFTIHLFEWIVKTTSWRSYQKNPCKDSECRQTIPSNLLGSCEETTNQSVSVGVGNARNHKRNCQSIVFRLYNANNSKLLQIIAIKSLHSNLYFIYCHLSIYNLFILWNSNQCHLQKSRKWSNFVLSKNRHHTSIFQLRQKLQKYLNNSLMTNETLFTIKEVVDKKLLGYKGRTIRQLIKDGKLWFVDISEKGSIRRIIRIPESAITKFIKSRTK